MWHVEISSKKWFKAAIGLDENQFGKVDELGTEGKKKTGYCFYKLMSEVEKDNGKLKVELDYITYKMGDKPVLTAVTKQQFKNWLKASFIIAIPAEFHWK